jgi:phosphoribosylformylglycinamidine synthase
MMPHPERAIDALHGSTDGQAMFSALVEATVAA